LKSAGQSSKLGPVFLNFHLYARIRERELSFSQQHQEKLGEKNNENGCYFFSFFSHSKKLT